MGLIWSESVTLTADRDFEIPPGLDLSRFKEMTLIVDLTDSGSGATNHLDVYLEHRWQDLAWIQRIHAAQLDGGQADVRLQYTIQGGTPLDPSEQGEQTALAEGAYRDGPFPNCVYSHEEPNYGGPQPTSLKRPVSNCRIHCDVTDGGTPDPSFAVGLYLYALSTYSAGE